MALTISELPNQRAGSSAVLNSMILQSAIAGTELVVVVNQIPYFLHQILDDFVPSI